jgi:23S rRNA pseudouridine1911/1915/1917 synthase
MAISQGPTSRRAVTHYALMEVFRDETGVPIASLIELELETGRTHQIRVHLAHIGHPVLGDPVYGSGFKTSARRLNEKAQAALAALDRQALHAAGLGFEHPVTGKRLSFESALPADFTALLEALRGAVVPKAGGKRSPVRKARSE